MALEIAEELVVVGGQVADGVVRFRGRVDDGLGVVGEAGQVGAVFFGEEGFQGAPFFGVVKLEGLIAAGCQKKFAAVVEGKGCCIRSRGGEFEKLVENGEHCEQKTVDRGGLTFVGRRLPMMSEVF